MLWNFRISVFLPLPVVCPLDKNECQEKATRNGSRWSGLGSEKKKSNKAGQRSSNRVVKTWQTDSGRGAENQLQDNRLVSSARIKDAGKKKKNPLCSFYHSFA